MLPKPSSETLGGDEASTYFKCVSPFTGALGFSKPASLESDQYHTIWAEGTARPPPCASPRKGRIRHASPGAHVISLEAGIPREKRSTDTLSGGLAPFIMAPFIMPANVTDLYPSNGRSV